jgi:MFS family permease
MGSPTLAWSFAALALIVAAAFPVGVYWADRRTGHHGLRRTALAAAGTVTWLSLTFALAATGRIGFDGLPPSILPVLLGMFTIALSLGFSRVGQRLAVGLPLVALVGFHAFRLPLELLMHRAYGEGIMPVQMSYSGMNFDILTGIGALVVAALLAAGRMPLRGVRVWNWLGTALLVNIITIAMLSTPLPIRVFSNEPANVWIAEAPFIWLPTVMVLMALLGHIVLFRRLRQERKAGRIGAASLRRDGPAAHDEGGPRRDGGAQPRPNAIATSERSR